MKQTAVDYFIEQMIEYDFSPRDNTYLIEIPSWIFKEKIEKARAMMMEQIIDAYNNGDLRSADLYYNQTYVSNGITLQNQSESKVITELSDEEIEKWVASTPYYGHCTTEYKEGLDEGAKWYREQLKQRQ